MNNISSKNYSTYIFKKTVSKHTVIYKNIPSKFHNICISKADNFIDAFILIAFFSAVTGKCRFNSKFFYVLGKFQKRMTYRI